MKKIEVIEDVSKFFILNGEAYVVSERTVNSKVVRSIEFDMPQKLFARGNDLYFTDDHGLSKFIADDYAHTRLTEFNAMAYEPFTQDKLLVTFKDEEGKRKIGMLSGSELLWSKDSLGLYDYFSESQIILERDAFKTSKLWSINPDNGAVNWEFKLPEGHFLKGDINKHDDVLVISCQEKSPAVKDKYTVLGISASGGHQIWTAKSSAFEFVMHSRSKQLYSFSSNNFGDNLLTILNPVDGSIETCTFNYRGSTSGHLNSLNQNMLYFASNSLGCAIGVINLTSLQSIEEYPLHLTEGVKIHKPQVIGNRLFVLDTQSILHIYQLDQNNIT